VIVKTASKIFSLPIITFVLLLVTNQSAFSQEKYGQRDTLLVGAIVWQGDTIPAKTLEWVWVNGKLSKAQSRKRAEWTRLRNAVYVTYPYAKRAGAIMNDINAKLQTITSESKKKSYIKSREKELKKEFADPLSDLSVYQGKVLMKLINRQTGNNCYEIVKEYRGGLNARLYQTVAFFFGSSLKQDYDIAHDATDRQIESIVKEIDGIWYNNPYKPGIR